MLQGSLSMSKLISSRLFCQSATLFLTGLLLATGVQAKTVRIAKPASGSNHIIKSAYKTTPVTAKIGIGHIVATKVTRESYKKVVMVHGHARTVTVLRAIPVAGLMIDREPATPSLGHLIGLDQTEDPLDLKSSAAIVIDQSSSNVLLSKNAEAVLPIASITKLMTSLVVLEANLPMDEMIEITDSDIDLEKGTGSRLKVGAELSRSDLLHLALMASENRAASALGRSYPGGLSAFVRAMNAKAAYLGMTGTHYVDSSGLSSQNVSTAQDLAKLVRAAYQQSTIREFSTSSSYSVMVSGRPLSFHSTNGLVASPDWDIGLQKTGYISEAGKCLVMQVRIAGKQVVMVLLDSLGKYTRLGDAARIRKWLESQG